jgi:hypothetical protein
VLVWRETKGKSKRQGRDGLGGGDGIKLSICSLNGLRYKL